MIEVHLVRFKTTATVLARDTPEFPQHLDGARLSNSDTVELELPVTPVVGDVCSTLTSAW